MIIKNLLIELSPRVRLGGFANDTLFFFQWNWELISVSLLIIVRKVCPFESLLPWCCFRKTKCILHQDPPSLTCSLEFSYSAKQKWRSTDRRAAMVDWSAVQVSLSRTRCLLSWELPWNPEYHEVSVDTPPRTLKTSLCFEFCFIYCSLASPLTSHPHPLCILPPPSWTLYTFSGLQFFTKHSLWVLPTWISL